MRMPSFQTTHFTTRCYGSMYCVRGQRRSVLEGEDQAVEEKRAFFREVSLSRESRLHRWRAERIRFTLQCGGRLVTLQAAPILVLEGYLVYWIFAILMHWSYKAERFLQAMGAQKMIFASTLLIFALTLNVIFLNTAGKIYQRFCKYSFLHIDMCSINCVIFFRNTWYASIEFILFN